MATREYTVGNQYGATFVAETDTREYVTPNGYIAETTVTTVPGTGEPTHFMHYQKLRRAQ
jgi:hypothetical protein